MSETLELNEAVTRFKDNEDRFDDFVNSSVGYLTSEGISVESIISFLDRLETEITAYADLTTRTDTLETEMDAAEADIADHETRLTAAESTITDHESRVTDLEAFVDDQWEVSLGSATPTDGLAFTADTETKIVIDVAPSTTPNGFDLFTTDDGAAIRFIGSGLGNGDSANFEIITSFSMTIGTGSGLCEFKGKTRPYTEALFANAEDLNYIGTSREFTNNDTGSVALAPQIVTITDGDLIEFSITSDSSISDVTFSWPGILIRRV